MQFDGANTENSKRCWKYVFCMVLPEALWTYDMEGADAFTNFCVPSTHIYSIVCKIMGVCPTWYNGTLLRIFLDADMFEVWKYVPL
jgi:hypothetical protein